MAYYVGTTNVSSVTNTGDVKAGVFRVMPNYVEGSIQTSTPYISSDGPYGFLGMVGDNYNYYSLVANGTSSTQNLATKTDYVYYPAAWNLHRVEVFYTFDVAAARKPASPAYNWGNNFYYDNSVTVRLNSGWTSPYYAKFGSNYGLNTSTIYPSYFAKSITSGNQTAHALWQTGNNNLGATSAGTKNGIAINKIPMNWDFYGYLGCYFYASSFNVLFYGTI